MDERAAVGVIVAGGIGLWLWQRRERPLTPIVTTSETFELAGSDYPAGLRRMAEAIARAEGFYVSGTVPQRARNPGDARGLAGSWDAVFDSVGRGGRRWAAACADSDGRVV